MQLPTVVDPEILKRGGDNVSALSSFITSAHNELYAFYMEKGDLLKKFRPIRGRLPLLLPQNLPLTADRRWGCQGMPYRGPHNIQQVKNIDIYSFGQFHSVGRDIWATFFDQYIN